MPTTHREAGYRFHFVSYDCTEPPHVHVAKGATDLAKIWLTPVEVQRSALSGSETREVTRIVKRNRSKILQIWHEHCGNLG